MRILFCFGFLAVVLFVGISSVFSEKHGEDQTEESKGLRKTPFKKVALSRKKSGLLEMSLEDEPVLAVIIQPPDGATGLLTRQKRSSRKHKGKGKSKEKGAKKSKEKYPTRPGSGGRTTTPRYDIDDLEPIVKVRLNGGPSFYEGRVEIYSDSRKKWVSICPNKDQQTTAEVMCRELGFTRGVDAVFSNGSAYGDHFPPASYELWNERRRPLCTGREESVRDCQQVRSCYGRYRNMALRCKPDKIGCDAGWVAFQGTCYHLFNMGVSASAAGQKCNDMNSHLLSLETPLENHFVSAWIASRLPSPGVPQMTWTSGEKLAQHGSAWLWLTTNQEIAFEHWFPGWPPYRINRQPVEENGRCLALSNNYTTPNGRGGVTEYHYWGNYPCIKTLPAICEKKPAPMEDCYVGTGTTYRGMVAITTKGTMCQRWTNAGINAETHPGMGLGDHNYCRNPDGDTRPWCYVNIRTGDFGYCRLSQCPDPTVITGPLTTPQSPGVTSPGYRPSPSDSTTTRPTPSTLPSCSDGDGSDYRGNVAATVAGTPCTAWSMSSIVNAVTHPGKGLGNHNFCRNPDSSRRPWCWIEGGRYGYCPVPLCDTTPDPGPTECRRGQGEDYRGSLMFTSQGTPCVQWSLSNIINAETHSSKGLGNHNFCRNPDGSRLPWCWVAGGRYGYCNIRECDESMTSFVTDRTTTPPAARTTTTVSSTGPTCPAQMFMCPESMCIPEAWVCDGDSDCYGGGDEEGCVCDNNEFQCPGSSRCLPPSFLCDGEDDCEDGSDEADCGCSESEFQCVGSFLCIPSNFKCDGDFDCPDRSDEANCYTATCTNNEFTCGEVMGQVVCLSWGQKCDGTVDCYNGRDEINCTNVSPNPCPDPMIRCSGSDPTCIMPQWKCDGDLDCPSGVDEQNCPTDGPRPNPTVSVCTEITFLCRDGAGELGDMCVPLTWKCDGTEDCRDGHDEQDCGHDETFLDRFEVSENTDLVRDDLDSTMVYLFATPEDCAKYCIESNFACKSFALDVGEEECYLYSADQTTVTLVNRPGVNYYQPSSQPADCMTMNQFTCLNGNCISQSKVCDGKNDCGDFYDEQVCTDGPAEVDVRLVGGDKESEGRVEVKYMGQWGVICDDEWDKADADVVCRQLGYSGALKAYTMSRFGSGTGEILLDDVRCVGTEQKLADCPHRKFGEHDCHRFELAGVGCMTGKGCTSSQFMCAKTEECAPASYVCDGFNDCSDKSDEANCTVYISLVGGANAAEGRVEILRNGVRGTICNDNFMNNNNGASVVCKMLGYGSGVLIENTFGNGEGVVWLDDVTCAGSESSVDDCEHLPWGQSNCEHSEDVAVRCSMVTMPTSVSTPDGSPRPTLSPGECGRILRVDKPDDSPFIARIVGGSRAGYGQYPWQLALLRYGSQFCGATIIDKRWAITAAHCFDPPVFPKSAFKVVAGDYNLKNPDKNEQILEVEEIISHENFDDITFDFDIAMIKVKSPGFTFSDYVQPACLPTTATPYTHDLPCKISGWGKVGEDLFGEDLLAVFMKGADIPLIETSQCLSLYKNDLTDRMICAGIRQGGVDSCQGDSGGPLVCEVNGINTLHGVVSWGVGCGKPNLPGVYANVQNLLPWIDRIMQTR